MVSSNIKLLERNVKFLKVSAVFDGMWTFTMVAAVYFESITNSYAVALSLISLVAIIQILTEIPTGIFSDKIGRKQTLVLAASLCGCTVLCWAMAGTFDSVSLLVVGVVLYGLALSFFSGTYDAFIYETMKALGREDEFDKVYSRIQILIQIARSFMAGFIAIITYIFPTSNLPFQIIYYCSVFISLAFVMCFVMCVNPKETEKIHHLSSFKHFKEGFKFILKNRKLRIFAVIEMFRDTLAYTASKMENVYFVTLVPFYLISVAGIVKNLMGMFGLYIAPYLKKFGFGNIIFASQYLISGIKLLVVVLNNFFSPFINTIVKFFDDVSDVALVSVMQDEFSVEQRATMGSIIAFGREIINTLILILLGVVADLYSIRIAFFFLIFGKIIVDTFTYFKFRKLKL